MFLKSVVLIMGSAVFGCATSAGTIALLTKLGVVPRIIARLQVAKSTIPAECAIILGAVIGCICSVYDVGRIGVSNTGQSLWQSIFLIFAALCTGVFVGCQAMALAEILNMFPILFRRAKLQLGLRWVVIAIALGKLVGSLWYFAFGYQSS